MGVLKLETRKGSQVDNFCDPATPVFGQVLQANALKAQFVGAVHKNTSVCFTYNCHGLTFAARRTQITKTSEIAKILREDGYVRVPAVQDVVCGDIILYVASDGSIDHSGMVVDNDLTLKPLAPKILSKWGSAHEVVHHYSFCPYLTANIQYWRLSS